MLITIWWDNMDIEEIDTTFLGFSDGYAAARDRLVLEGYNEAGIRLHRRYYGVKGKCKSLIEEECVLVQPDDLVHVIRLERNGETILEQNGRFELENVAFREAAGGLEMRQVDGAVQMERMAESGVISDDEREEAELLANLDRMLGAVSDVAPGE